MKRGLISRLRYGDRNGLSSRWRSHVETLNNCADSGSTRVSPDIHSRFIEHLGGCIYDGISVGQDGIIEMPGRPPAVVS